MVWSQTFSQNYYRLSITIYVIHDRLWKVPRIRFFLQISPKLEPLQKFILAAIIWIVTLDTSEDALRDDTNYYCIGEYLVWHWSQNQQDKHDLQVSDGQITVKLQQNEVPRDWKISFAKEYVILGSYGHTFSISHRLWNKWACDQVIPSLIFFYKDRESQSHKWALVNFSR